MDNDDLLSDLLARWYEGYTEGRDVSAAELCPGRPDLVAELERRVAQVRHLHELAGLPTTPAFASTISPGHTEGPVSTASPAALPTGGSPLAEVGQKLAGFHLLHLLGEGGMGRVFEAEEVVLNRRVALKVMHAHVAARPDARQRFLREARAAAAIHHDHVVPVFQVGEADGVPFLAMPLLAGESLEARLRRDGPLPVGEAVRIAREAAEGLAAAHARGLIHRDVKPANLWLEAPTGRVKILDFGLARAEEGDGLTHQGAILGTPGYMAPEQIDGEELDARCDLFSLGCVLYRTLTGRPAFEGKTITALLSAATQQNPTPPAALNPAVPEALSALVMRLLAKDREARPADAATVVNVLAAIGTPPPGPLSEPERGRKSEQFPSPPPAPRTKERRTGGFPRWKLIAAALVLVAGWVMWLLTYRTGPRVVEMEGKKVSPGGDGRPVSYRGSVDLLVIRPDFEGGDIPVPLRDPRAMPLRPGDHFKIVAEIEPPAYLYLFWVDETGAGVPVYPWAVGQWGTRLVEEKPLSRLEVKAPNGNWLKVTGEKAGMETVLMLARPTPLAKDDGVIQGWFAGLKPLPLRGEKARVWFENFDLLRNDAARSFSYDDDLTKDGSPLGLQGLLRRRIGAEAGFSRAISFARLGIEKVGK